MSFVSWPPSLTPEQLEHLTLLATTYALAHSLLYLPPHEPNTPPPPAPVSAIHAPLSLFPTPIPRVLFHRAQRLQRAYNNLYARVALDTAFLDEVMGTGPTGAGAVDEFTGALWKAWKASREEGPVQTWHLGLFRSDYLLHQPEGAKEIELKQVEFNTISSSFGALSEQVSKLHRHLQATTHYFDSSSLLQPGNFPPNDTIAVLAAGLAEAHTAYGNPSASILFVVQPDERNIFDQRLLEYELLEKHNIHVHRRTFAQLAEHAHLSATRTLHISPLPAIPSSSATHEISVVYYRAGYTPTDYPTPQVYDTRLLLERSRAIQCPSLALQLAGGKKVQEVLTRPGVLERFLDRAEDIEEVRASWVRMWGLDASADDVPIAGASAEGVGKDDEPAGTRCARARAQDLVLKPQREGGGNNVYKQAIPPFLDTLPARERAAWIAMELIKPPRGVGGYLVRAGGGEAGVMRAEVVSELGIFGWALFGGEGRGGVAKKAEVGWLVRTKGEGVNEGGVAAGFSVLDSVLLVD
ncbi:glutathione synthase [Dentipellis sp. KUC8613]|nr:glutathione synthase [Dentipellis sp. KUC8613]